MRSARLVAGAVVIVAAAAAGALWWLNRAPDPAPVAERFLEGLAAQSVDPQLLADPALAGPATQLVVAAIEELGSAPRVTVQGAEKLDDGSAAARAEVTWPLATTQPWTYATTVPLQVVEGEWRVVWSPSVLHPRLGAGETLDVRFTAPQRAPIIGGTGRALFTRRPIVTIGIEPRRVRDLDATAAALARSVAIEPAPLRSRVEAAAPDAFVEVITLRREDYQPLRSDLRPIPGVVFRESERQLAPSPTFGRALLGRVGPATEEVLAEAGPGFEAGDELGLSGLQREFQRQLAGRPGTRVVAVAPNDRDVATLYDVPAQPGQPLRTTLDPAVQAAAEAALTSVAKPSALVAVRPSTGAVLAVANGPDGGTVDTALTGQYPPGSTFKVVSTAALLANGIMPNQPVECPPTATLGGRTFRNAEGAAAGRVPFALAFAESCNTTVAPLAVALPDDAVRAAAASFGFAGEWSPGTAAFTGQVPPAADTVERAAEAIGQGRVLASPLVMAGVAAAVANGTWRPPTLLPDHAQPGAGARSLAPTVAAALRGMLRQVVTKGTGTALAAVPGLPVLAKTGTAEFGTVVPPQTHAWVSGAQGDLAFAVLVEDGGAGGAVAAPVATRFLRALG